MRTILISRADLAEEPIRVVYPVIAMGEKAKFAAKDFFQIVISKERNRALTAVDFAPYGIGENDGEVWTIEEIEKWKTGCDKWRTR